MKLYHAMTKKNKLTQNSSPGDKYLFTTMGNFKVRKNGRIILSIDEGENKEIVRVTPIMKFDRQA